jgi:hypothetical protein
MSLPVAELSLRLQHIWPFVAMLHRLFLTLAAGLFLSLASAAAVGQQPTPGSIFDVRLSDVKASRNVPDTPANVLSPAEWQRVDGAVERGLQWLASQQQADGSFPTMATGQPAITSLCMMAFIAHGYVPGDGPYGKRLEKATEYVLSCQKKNGLVTLLGPEGERITRQISHEIGGCATYNHGISSLVLSEIYGMSPPADARQLQAGIAKAVSATLEMQRWPKDYADDRGGWRYIDHFDDKDSDL